MRWCTLLIAAIMSIQAVYSQDGTVCYGKNPFTKTACITSTQTVRTGNQQAVRQPTAVLMEIIGSGLPALPVVATYNSQDITFTSIIANKQTTTGTYMGQYLTVTDTATGTLRTNKFQYGSATVTAFETAERCQRVDFLNTMSAVPSVKLSTHTQNSEELIYYWLRGVSTTGFEMCFHEGVLFSGAHTFNVHYVAIADQGQIPGQRDIQVEHGKARLLAGSQATQGTQKFCHSISFGLTYREAPHCYVTAEQDAGNKCKATFISWISATSTTGATICARNTEDQNDGVRARNVTINWMCFGSRIDIVPGMAQLEKVSCSVYCKDVTFPVNKFFTGLPMHVQLTATWQKTPVLVNGNHEASAVWAESLTHNGFKACALVAGRHYDDNYPIPAVNWLAYQLPASQCVKPPLIGGTCGLPDWYTGARCCSINIGKQIPLGSNIQVSVRHSKTRSFIDAMTAWAELSACNGTTFVRLCARELQNFDGLHQNIVLHWLLVETALPPFIPVTGQVTFQRQFYSQALTMPAVCADVTYPTNLIGDLPIATVIMSPKNNSIGCFKCNHDFSVNDMVTWIETRDQEKMRVCMKSLRSCLHREQAFLSYIVVTEPRCKGRTTGFYLKDNFCHDYFQCNDGAYSEGSCGANQYFNLVTGQCQTAVPTGCQDPRCINVVNGFYLQNTVCRSYYQCQNGFYTAFTCAANQYFNIQTGACQAAVPTGCQDPRCNNIANGFYLLNNLCSSYYQCSNGFYSIFTCAANQYYNLQSGQCQTAVPVGCQDPKCIGQANGFYLVNNLCSNYYRCADGLYTANSCAAGSYFNLVSGQCQSTVPAGCKDPRCLQLNDGFYLVNNICKSYYQCNGGFYNAFTCANNQYFNTQTGACQAAVPQGCQDPRCVGQTDGFYLINNLCRSYYRCANGFYTANNCANNQYFNLQSGQCQTALPSGCQDPRCTGRANGFFRIDNFCTSYFRCQDGFYSTFTCNQGQYFDLTSNQCGTNLPSGCRDPRCTGVANGFYLTNNVCNSYYQCTDGFYTGFTCPNNGYYNVQNNQCQSTVPNGCQDPRCAGRGDGLFVLNNLCSAYFRCQGGFYTLTQCPNNGGTQQYFNAQTGTCQVSLPSGCQDPRCTGRADGVYVLNNLCTSYFRCQSGFYTLTNCQNGQYFNSQTGGCGTQLPAGCQDPRCIGRADGSYVLNNQCQQYYTCTNSNYQLLTCAGNQYFNQATGSCQAQLPSGCSDPRCNNRVNGNYILTNDNLCRSYFSCNNGIYSTTTCPTNQYFNSANGQCQTTLPSGCADPRCTGIGNGNFKLSGDTVCTTYFNCNNGIYALRQCQANTYFNGNTGACQSQLPAGCQDPRCNNIGNGLYRIQGDTQCRNYFQCQSGVYSILTCPNNQYFDSATGSCGSNLPSGCQDPRCNGIGNGNFRINGDTVCKTYFTCNNGIYSLNTCANNGYFNSQNGQCQSQIPAGCQDPRCNGIANGRYLLNNLCTAYYTCASGVYTLTNCPGGTQYFNSQTGQCQSQVPNGCQDPICIGRQDGFYVTNNLCVSYFRCQSGISSSFSCQNGQFYNVATQQCQSTTPSGCQDSFCQTQTNGNYPVDNVCRTYFTCNNGFKTTTTCANGGYYNSQTRVCQTSVPNGCQNPECATRGNGNFVVDTNCQGYFTCLNGIKTSGTCTQGLYYNIQTGACQANVPSGCANPQCQGKQNGNYLVNNLCQNYFTCTNGAYQLNNCPTNTYFNTATGQCQSQVPAGCINPLCSGRQDGLYVSNNLCQSYFRCAQGVYTALSCNNGLYFNSANGQCQSAVPTGCQNPLCGGRANGYIQITDGSTCQNYFTCNNGFQTIAACQNGQYMNTATGQCQSQVPAGCGQNAVCANQVNGNYRVINDVNCRTYYTCSNQIYSFATCQTNVPYFNQQTGQCQSAVPQGCQAIQQTNVCTGRANGLYTTDNYCGSFFQCVNSQAPTIQSCNQGQYYNTNTQSCQTQVPAQCYHPSCYTTDANNIRSVRSGTFVNDNTCTGGYVCSQGIISNQLTCGNQWYNTATGQCVANQPANCQTRVVQNQCTGQANGFYNADPLNGAFVPVQQTLNGVTQTVNQPLYLCRAYFQCNNQQFTAGVCPDAANGQAQYIDRADGQCKTALPTGQNCMDPRCYTVTTQQNNQIVTTVKNNANYIEENTCGTGYTCTNGLIQNVRACPRIQGQAPQYYNINTGACQTAQPSGCTAVPQPSNAPTCVGKADNDRIAHESDPTKFYVCQNGAKTTESACPTASIFPANAPNGKYFSPYFKTCINTTTGNPPAHTPTGESDMCNEIATYVAFGFSGTRLPDVNDCRKWIQCTDQKFVPQSRGSCVSQPYNPDKQFCEFTHKCFFPPTGPGSQN